MAGKNVVKKEKAAPAEKGRAQKIKMYKKYAGVTAFVIVLLVMVYLFATTTARIIENKQLEDKCKSYESNPNLLYYCSCTPARGPTTAFGKNETVAGCVCECSDGKINFTVPIVLEDFSP